MLVLPFLLFLIFLALILSLLVVPALRWFLDAFDSPFVAVNAVFEALPGVAFAPSGSAGSCQATLSSARTSSCEDNGATEYVPTCSTSRRFPHAAEVTSEQRPLCSSSGAQRVLDRYRWGVWY